MTFAFQLEFGLRGGFRPVGGQIVQTVRCLSAELDWGARPGLSTFIRSSPYR